MSEEATKQVPISIIMEQETLDKITDIQKKTGIFSRSKVLREIINAGLKSVDEKR